MRLYAPDLDERAASGDMALLVRGVAVDAVLRVLRNPDGKVQEGIDDYTYRRADAVADGALYLTPAEITLIGSRPGPQLGSAFTVSLWG